MSIGYMMDDPDFWHHHHMSTFPSARSTGQKLKRLSGRDSQPCSFYSSANYPATVLC